ncbi:MAG: AraC family transcriptional regulator [Rikenellaceae bacterium]
MTHLIYFNIRLIIAGMLLTLGAYLFSGIIPSKLRGSIFDSSRKCIGLAVMVMPLSTILVYFASLRFQGFNLHVVSYLTACYTISILVTVGFVPLLGGKFNFRQWRFIRGLISIPFFAMPMILTNIYGDEQSVEIAKIATTVLLMVTISYQSYIFFKFYRVAIRRGDNYYSEDIKVDINWIVRSVLAFFSLEMICAISTFFSDMGFAAELLLTIYRVATIVYVFSQFMQFMKNFESKMGVCNELQLDEVKLHDPEAYYKSLSDEQHQQIATRLDRWVRKSGYSTIGVTIEDVAIEVATNRTYLSIYINTTFGCSFKAWVTQQRIDRAKSLLRGNDTTIEISRSVGFSSPQSFMHSFKRSEGCTPTQWRNMNKI